MRIFAIPDIHGRLDLLNKLLELLYTQESLNLFIDKIVFLGDMIDRGPNSKGVLDRVKELQAQFPNNVVILAGNHEWLAIDAYLRKQDEYLWLVNGGTATLASFGVYTTKNTPGIYSMGDSYYVDGKMPESYVRWLSSLPLQHEEPGFFFSHAPVPRENRRNILYRGTSTFSKDELTWTYDRDEFGVARDFGNGTIGVCGHIHQLDRGVMAPRFYDHYIFADAGCGCSEKAPLVAVEVATRKVTFAWP